MKLLKIGLFLALAGCLIQAGPVSPDPVVFVASSPCDMIPRAMLSIPADASCEFIKWRLALQRHPRPQQQQAPTMYTLDYTYGMTKPSTMAFLNGGTSLEKTGQWAIRKEPGNREIYVLNPDTPETAISFIRLDDNLLHLLDREGKLMIGHGGWSYTLNRK